MNGPTARYQVGILGGSKESNKRLKATLRHRVRDLGLRSDAFAFLAGPAVKRRDRRLPFLVVYFGQSRPSKENEKLLDEVLLDSPVVVPAVDDLKSAHFKLPRSIAAINALEMSSDDPGLERLCSVVLQHFRLLRKERRVFISYRRKEAGVAAAQIYDALDERGFDVFLDTRSVPPGEDFQQVLWHRMADSDVVILLDTPGFADSRWTVAELARANATNIQILQLLWPGSHPQGRTALSHIDTLKPDSFVRVKGLPNAGLKVAVVKKICAMVESLRARAIAARHRFLVDALCDLARTKGLHPVVHSDRSVRIDGASRAVAIVPLVGVPTSLHLEEEFASVGSGSGAVEVYVMYDERGLLRRFKDHLNWLNGSLPIRSVGVFEVTRVLDEVAS